MFDMRRISLYELCIQNKREDILEDWDADLNLKEGHTPQNVSRGCDSFKAHWKCHKCGYRWDAVVYSRTGMNCGCPKCGKKRAINTFESGKIAKEGSLYDNYKELIDNEWDYQRNQELGLDPKKLSSGSLKEAWWVCPKCGFEYKTRIANRSVHGHGCRKCSRAVISLKSKKTRLRKGNLKRWAIENHCEYLIDEWNVDKNLEQFGLKGLEDITYGNSDVSVWWKCSKCGYEWQAVPSNRTIGGTNCPLCSSEVVVSGRNDLATMYPELIKEWDFSKNGDLDPHKIASSYKKKVWWVCPKGHHYQTSVVSRAKQKTGCPICSAPYSYSISEKIISYYLKKCFVIEENKKLDFLDGMELDIYCPKYKFAVEYDGARWHKNIRRDKKKDFLCNSSGVFLIRVREEGLPDYQSDSLKIAVKHPKTDHAELEPVILQLMDILQKKTGVNTSIKICLKEDYQTIRQSIEEMEVKHSVYDSPLMKEWDFKRNGNIN